MSKTVVSADEYRRARSSLLSEEKAATRLLSSVAEKRRALPMVRLNDPSSFVFAGPSNRHFTLLDLFQGRRQLIIYFHMPFSPTGVGCGGCSFFSDHIPAGRVLSHLHSRDTTFAAAAPESVTAVDAFQKRMGWTFPFYSCLDTFTKADELGDDITWRPSPGAFRLSCFLREGDEVFHTYETTSRGVEVVLSTYALLDMTLLGRQESGEEAKSFRLHDEYTQEG
ncbi:uncharacterized protein HMPREF1541_07073 [Cyphellophora europaea CBS 101466]|uniref:Thioredoxin domain-containing protein n=1 Tax=Cyphellophora europaea (strain CBS 101466) TaxID=1220924 RepID=W2RR92_CYPE1|nr:uncharacterized protein HMPREF1541_07073 [Cyphellophora europaea CBS 101466]ETN39031.1 hypothetical protein HMPREF1541_07073 [Cyphellophora europaea CBS 101466]